MQSGKILVSQSESNYLIKLVGDVRVTLCASLGDYIDTIFNSGEAEQVLVDFGEAESVDSTTLGLLAKLALHCQRQFHLRVQAFCSDETLLHTLAVMGLDELFELHPCCNTKAIGELSELDAVGEGDTTGNDTVCQRVLESHHLLSSLNARNKKAFVDLIEALEQQE